MLLRELTQQLSQQLNSRLEADLILGFVLNLSREKLIISDNFAILEADLAKIYELAKKRQTGYPMAYILGKKEFYSREFLVTEDTLIPRPETENLIEEALNLTKNLPNLNVLDLGTGSGIIAVTFFLEAKKRGQSLTCDAVDLSLAALKVAKENATHLEAQINFYNGSWFTPLVGKKYNLILANPPYVDRDLDNLGNEIFFEPAQALFAASRGIAEIEIILKDLKSFLLPAGHFLCEIGAEQGAILKDLSYQMGFTSVRIINDYSGRNRILAISM